VASLAGIATRMASWVRSTGNILLNSPDGWLDTNGPVWWFGSDQQVATTPDGFATLTSVGRATSLVVDPIVDAPWRLRRVSADPTDNAGEPLPLPRWVADPQLARPDERLVGGGQLVPAAARLTGAEFWGQLLTWSLWWGRGMFMFVPDSQGQPTAGTLRVLDPRKVPIDTQAGFERWQVGTNGPYTDRAGRFRLGPVTWQVVCVRDAPLYGPTGDCTGVLTRYMAALGLEAQIQAYARTSFRSGVPAGLLKVSAPGLTKDQADTLKQAWMDAHGGGARSVAVLNATTDFSPLQFNAVDAELVAAGRASRLAVAHAFGMEGHWLDASDQSNTYANINDRHRQLWAHTQKPRATRLMTALTALLPAGQELSVDSLHITNLNPGDWAQYVTGLRDARLVGWSEARDMLGLPRLAQPEPEPTTPDVIPGEVVVP
jgi:HK97 family phage portal protein